MEELTIPIIQVIEVDLITMVIHYSVDQVIH